MRADSVLGHMEASPHHAPFAPAPGTLRRRVHNGVEHSATEGGAFCGVMLPPNPAAAAAAQQQLQQRGGGGAFSAHPGAGEPRLVYSDRCGRLRLRDVRVVNRGVDWEAPDNVYWRHKVGWAGLRVGCLLLALWLTRRSWNELNLCEVL